jgi:2-iminobutanoate/2-iminopropanoate deaminase
MADIETIQVEGIYKIFSAHATRHNGLVYVSGCVSLDENSKLVGPGDMAAQTRQTIANLERVLAAAGTDLAHVLKTTVFMTDLSKRAESHKVRRELFNDRMPASSLVEVTALAGDGLMIEIEAIAAMP